MIRAAASSLALAVTVAILVASMATAETTQRTGGVPVHAIATTIPILRDAAALGKAVALDPQAAVAEFRIACGWYVKPKRRVRRGLWTVKLRGVSFQWETYPAGPASGISHSVSLETWERRAELHGWTGTLRLASPKPYLSNGPTTDICGGVLG